MTLATFALVTSCLALVFAVYTLIVVREARDNRHIPPADDDLRRRQRRAYENWWRG